MAEVAGFLGHKMERFATTEIYARYAPDYRGAAVRAIDDFSRELSPLLARPLLGFVPQVVDFTVGVTPYTLFLQFRSVFA